MDGAQTVRLYSTMGTKWVFDPWVEEREVFEEEKTWVWLENTLVQILVVVVITKLRTFWTEVENGFRWRAFRSEWVDPKRFVKHDKKWNGFFFLKAIIELKGKTVNIPLLGYRVGRGACSFRGRVLDFYPHTFFWDICYGDVKELWDWGGRRE